MEGHALRDGAVSIVYITSVSAKVGIHLSCTGWPITCSDWSCGSPQMYGIACLPRLLVWPPYAGDLRFGSALVAGRY